MTSINLSFIGLGFNDKFTEVSKTFIQLLCEVGIEKFIFFEYAFNPIQINGFLSLFTLKAIVCDQLPQSGLSKVVPCHWYSIMFLFFVLSLFTKGLIKDINFSIPSSKSNWIKVLDTSINFSLKPKPIKDKFIKINALSSILLIKNEEIEDVLSVN